MADGASFNLAAEQRRALWSWIQSIEAERQGKVITGKIALYLPPAPDLKKAG